MHIYVIYIHSRCLGLAIPQWSPNVTLLLNTQNNARMQDSASD